MTRVMFICNWVVVIDEFIMTTPRKWTPFTKKWINYNISKCVIVCVEDYVVMEINFTCIIISPVCLPTV